MTEPTSIALVGAAALAVAGFAWLALAMDAHWAQVHGGDAPVRAVRRLLRVLGISGLLASAVLCLQADHPTMAVLVWVMLLAAAALLVALTLTWRPRLLRTVWPWA
jgi:hypothetical protein